MTGLYCFAERMVQINSLYSDIHTLCRDYRAEGKADFTVTIEPGDITFERCHWESENEKTVNQVPSYSDGYLETLAVYRKIAEKMPSYDTVLFHGSAIAVDGEAYLFIAKSGVGKSTHTRLWRELLGERAVMVNDDKPLVRITQRGATVYGTPWDGKHRLSCNIAVPLKAVCLLERAKENTIHTISESEAILSFLKQVYRPSCSQGLKKTLALLDLLMKSVGLYRLCCNKQPQAAKIAFETMKGNK